MKSDTLTRLFQLVSLLQGDRCPNTRDLAESCEVSRRTIHRDLDRLERAGIPVQYHVLRQGYCLGHSIESTATGLSEREVTALVVASETAAGLGAMGLSSVARSAVDKLIRILPGPSRARVASIMETLEPIAQPRIAEPDRKAVHASVMEALASRKQARLCYAPADSDGVVTTKLAIYRLVLVNSAWCLVGRSTLHRGVVLLEMDWIRDVAVTEDPSEIPPRFSSSRFLTSKRAGAAVALDAWPKIERVYDVRLRLTHAAAMEIPQTPIHPSQRITPFTEERGAGVYVTFQMTTLEPLVGWVLSLGTSVDVLSPPELGERVRDVALAVALRLSVGSEPHFEVA